ncbi:MAG: hypothetical protein SVV03_05445 [Candidatus Nanohaloarchaea archaeon]|nr:hypothetical protein [Candidatus Nanohaloarchaea archaeon]
MVVKEQFEGDEAYKCEDCGFHYSDKETAEKCEDYCKQHSGCSSKLAQKALETGN